MAQSSFLQMADTPGAAFRANLNTLLMALATMHSGPTPPSDTEPFMPWFDTSVTPAVLRFRNAADTAWVDYDMRAAGLGVDTLTTGADPNSNTISGLRRAAPGAAGNPLSGEAFSYLQLAGSVVGNRIQIAIGETSGRVFWRRRSGSFNAWSEAASVASLTGLLETPLNRGTPISPTGTTVAEFVGIPSWARRVTAMMLSASTVGTSPFVVQLGTSAGFVSSGYSGSGGDVVGATAAIASVGFQLGTASAASAFQSGAVTIENIGGNQWVAFGGTTRADAAQVYVTGGSVSLPGVLDRVRIATTGANIDAGTFNVIWE